MVEQQVVAFEGTDLPLELLDWLRRHRVVLMGEVHGIVEHQALVVALAKSLQGTGTRQLLLEGAQAESWLADQYVLGVADSMPPLSQRYLRAVLQGIRGLNSALPAAERLHVQMVDINHRDWALPASVALMIEQGVRHRAAETFLASLGKGWARFETPEGFSAWRKANVTAYASSLAKFERALQKEREGDQADVLLEMVQIAKQSLAVREVWELQGEHAAHPQREEVIKSLVERALEHSRGTVLINMGGYHLQLKHVMGTPKVWLGEYLRTASPLARDSVATVYVALARQQRGDETVFDLTAPPVPGELLAMVHAKAGRANAYLPLRHQAFGRKVPVSYGGNVVNHAPREQFDAFLLLASGRQD